MHRVLASSHSVPVTKVVIYGRNYSNEFIQIATTRETLGRYRRRRRRATVEHVFFFFFTSLSCVYASFDELRF